MTDEELFTASASIINNNLPGNHYQRIIDIAKCADTLYIVSPFLMESFDTFFCEFKDNGINIKNIHLITTLKDNSMDLLRKANTLHSFCSLCLKNSIQSNIYIDNKLHGKIYVASKNGAYVCGMLTSANFTESGLNYNHEWGLWIDDPKILEILMKEVFEVCSQPLSEERITNIIEKVDKYFENKQEPEQPKPDLSISEFIDFNISVSNKRYFIKPIGSSEEPYPETSKLDNGIIKLHFSKRKPRAVREGDILICYAVGSTKLLGYFEVTTPPAFLGNDDDRWPWYVKAKNLCPSYSEKWTIYNNTLASVQEKFTNGAPITYIGGKTLGSLNYGSDKIRLTECFAKYLIHIIEQAPHTANHG
jgi:HKD family nuclease